MEILTNSANRKVYLDVPITPLGNTMTVTISHGDVSHEVGTVAAESPGRFSVTVPYVFVQYDSELTIEWKFQYEENGETHDFTYKTFASVATPYLSLAEVDPILGNLGFTDSEMLAAEQAVRHIINAHTGQSFGNFVGTKNVWSRGGVYLMLPDNLRQLNSVDGIINHNYFVDPSGFILQHSRFGVPPVKADFYGLHQHVGGVIHNPNNVGLVNFATRNYAIDGEWGYSSVPQAVKEAAVLMVSDYSDPDSQYRDRYLQSMTAADWRIQFNDGAFAATGNARADQLLSPFIVKSRWAVI